MVVGLAAGEGREVTLEDAGGASILREIIGLPVLGEPGRFSGDPSRRGGVALRGGDAVSLSSSARRTREGEVGGVAEEE